MTEALNDALARADFAAIRSRLEALKTGWTSIAQWQQVSLDFVSLDFVRHVIEDETALLAAIDDLTQRVTWMTTDNEGNVIDFAADLDVAVRALNAAELDNVLKQRAIDELTAKSVVIDATVAAFAGDKSAVVRSLRARIDDLTARNAKLEELRARR